MFVNSSLQFFQKAFSKSVYTLHKSYYFRDDDAPVLQTETEGKYFSIVVKTDFADSHHRFDQCGIVMYLDSENWLKASVEHENMDTSTWGVW